MRRLALGLVVAIFSLGPAFAAEETWTGKISDSMCGPRHEASAEHGKKMTEKECTLGCVKGGGKFVFVQGDKVLSIANQDFEALRQYAGDEVELTGELKDDTIIVSKIVPAKGK